MVESAKISRRAERDLDSLLSFVDDLPALEAEWDGLEEGPRASLTLEWDHLMADYLTELDEFACAGKLSQDQQQRYQDLKQKLKDLMPLIHKHNWYRPTISLDSVA